MSALAAYDAGWREWTRLVRAAAGARRQGHLAVAAQADRKADRQSSANEALLEAVIRHNHATHGGPR